jgi:(2R)-sulfolactate sulfo-lyase subunit beta
MIHFLVHDENDSCGVVVVEGIKAGETLTGWVMDQDKTIHIQVTPGHPDRPQAGDPDARRGRHGDQVRRRHRPRRGADPGGRASPRPQRQDEAVVGMDITKATFQGYVRENGRVGVRNHVVILPVDDLSNAASEAVANNIKGTLAIPHPYGRLQFGADLDLHFATLIGTGSNPNVAAVVVIGIEPGWTKRVVDGIAATGKPVEGFWIEGNGDTRRSCQRQPGRLSLRPVGLDPAPRRAADPGSVGVDQVRRVGHHVGLRLQPDRRQRLRQALRRGLHAGLRRDHRTDRRRAPGGGALPHARGARAFQFMFDRYQAVVERHKTSDLSESQPTKGNIAGGLTTIEEKALGNIQKIGRSAWSTACSTRPRCPPGPACGSWTPRRRRPRWSRCARPRATWCTSSPRGRATSSATRSCRSSSSAPIRDRADDASISTSTARACCAREASRTSTRPATRCSTCMLRTANGELTRPRLLGHREFVLTRLYESA